ncbi:Competence protein ComEA helix-hairpin-helix repeat protein [Planktothrix serta PCC 8927]|uniref:phospholipase D n=1 Tax=Planktothrix serta PCC 8927 TaxID=671068 RepID=A0A7Z9E4M5_9CYAN|nr:Competence protein ComEA helix-hairpin-helix repeat protein [Planktothrix serta PCC 8927]
MERHQAGVQVRVILENTYRRPWSSLKFTEIQQLPEREKDRYQEFILLADLNRDGTVSSEESQQRDALILLENAGIPIVDDTEDGSKGTGLMHHKFMVVDSKNIIITSANWTTSDVHGDFQALESQGNANNLLKIENAKLAQLLTQEFDLMWGDGVGKKKDSLFGIEKPFRGNQTILVGNIPVTVQFSPTSGKQPWQNSTNGLIEQQLQKATQSFNFALFVFSSQAIVNTLEKKHQNQVLIQGLIDPDFAYRSYSEGLDMMGIALVNQCRYEAENHPWKQPLSTIGIPNLYPSDRLHHKFGIIDGKIVITGSHNWTEAANTQNDETLIVIKNQTVADHFQREFERLYQNSTLGIPSWLLTKIEKDLKACGGSIATKSTNSKAVETVNSASSDIKINLNTATQAELETLPGVGAKLAQNIIATRQKKPFTSLKDLDQMPGVGPKLLEKISDRVTW